MSLTLVTCPKCGSSRQVIRTDKHDVNEIFPSYVDGEETDSADEVTNRGNFFCPDCNWEFSGDGQTFNESLMLVKR